MWQTVVLGLGTKLCDTAFAKIYFRFFAEMWPKFYISLSASWFWWYEFSKFSRNFFYPLTLFNCGVLGGCCSVYATDPKHRHYCFMQSLAEGPPLSTSRHIFLFHTSALVSEGLWIRIHFLRIRIQQFFSMRIRIQRILKWQSRSCIKTKKFPFKSFL